MPQFSLDERLADLARETAVDVVSLAEVMQAARLAADLDPAMPLRDRTFQALRQMLGRGFQLQALDGERQHMPDPDQAPDSILRRIAAAWDAEPNEAVLGYSFWFDLPGHLRPPAGNPP